MARSLSWKRCKKYTFNEPDPTFEVVYLGNVLCSLVMKGAEESSYEKPLSLIWKTYCQKKRADITMTLQVTRTGLKAFTKDQGITEYWAHRISYCCAPQGYARVFIWIYKHEGKRLKPETRCHAALCRKPDHPATLTAVLRTKIVESLSEYKREKIARQNIRLAGSQVPLRRQMLTSAHRPPLARSRSAPRLQSIMESSESEEDIDDLEEEDSTETRTLCGTEFYPSCSSSVSSTDMCASSSSKDSNTSTSNVYPPISLATTPVTRTERAAVTRITIGGEDLVDALPPDSPVSGPMYPPFDNSTTRSNTAQQPIRDLDTISDESGYHESPPPDENEPDVVITCF